METTVSEAYDIVNTSSDDLEFVYWLFDEAIAYQQRNDYPVWNGYSKEVLQREMQEQLQFKIVRGKTILCVFSICYADPIIWREMEKGNAIYLHRIVVNPEFKGQRQFEKLLHWAIAVARERMLKYVRMDTWANNPNIIAYYKSYGFTFIENFTMPDSNALPINYRKLALALLELEV